MKNSILYTGLSALFLLSACGQNTSTQNVSDADIEGEMTSQVEMEAELNSVSLSAEDARVNVVQRRLETLEPKAEYDVAKPKIIAATIHADWCGKCKTLDPKITAIRAANPFSELSFVVLDYTAKNETTFYAAADAAGIGAAIRNHLSKGVKTGQVLLVSTTDNTVIDTIKSDINNTKLIETLKSALETG